jgi:hypothetical protein
MIAFFNPVVKHLIIVPHKCGTTIMTTNSGMCGLNVIQLSNDYSNVFIKDICAQPIKKTFITRDPLIRYFSFFKTFAYTPLHQSLVVPKKLTNNFYEDISNSIPLLKKYYDQDIHTQKQYSFFSIFDENIDEYEFIDTAYFNKWLYLSFGKKTTEYISSMGETLFPKTVHDLSTFIDVKNELKHIYEEDYLIYAKSHKI